MKYLENLKHKIKSECVFHSVLFGIQSNCLLKTDGSFNGQNPLSVMKGTFWWPLVIGSQRINKVLMSYPSTLKS